MKLLQIAKYFFPTAYPETFRNYDVLLNERIIIPVSFLPSLSFVIEDKKLEVKSRFALNCEIEIELVDK